MADDIGDILDSENMLSTKQLALTYEREPKCYLHCPQFISILITTKIPNIETIEKKNSQKKNKNM